MASLDRYNSRATPTGEASTGLIDTNAVKSDANNVTKVGIAIQGVADKWQNAVNSTVKTTSQNNLVFGTNETLAKASQDSSFENKEQYYAELDTYRANALADFTDNNARAAFEPEVDRLLNQAKSKLDGLYRTKVVGHKLSQRAIQRSGNYTNYVETGLQHYIDLEKVQTHMTFQEGFIDEIDATEDNLKADNWVEDRENSIKTRKEIVSRRIKENQINEELGILGEVLKSGIDGISNEQVINLSGKNEEGAIRQKFAQALVEYKNDPRVYRASKKSDPAFDAYLRVVLEASDKETINNTLYDILNKKEMKKDNLTVLFQVAHEKSLALRGIDIDEGEVIEQKKSVFQSVMGIFQSKDIAEEEKTEAVKKAVSEAGKGKTVEEAVDISEKEALLRQFPIIRTYPKQGFVKEDKFGNRRRWFPDGRYEDLQ